MPRGCWCVAELNNEASEPCRKIFKHGLKFSAAHFVCQNVLELSQGQPAQLTSNPIAFITSSEKQLKRSDTTRRR